MTFSFRSTREAAPAVAYLREMMGPKDRRTLHQAQISYQADYENFSTFAEEFWRYASYGKPQGSKFETFSFSPTLYEESDWRPKSKPDAPARFGTWRVGEAAAEVLTVGYFDLDNHHSERSMVTLDEVEAILRELGLSFMLYTSYSHTPKKHKVRIIIPISREATWAEMFDVFARLNKMYDYQLDGSIYDPGDHLYGPTFAGERREWFGGGSLDVDAVLSLALSEEDHRYAQRGDERTIRARREWSPEEIQEYKLKIADESVTVDVTIENPKIFNPKWREDVETLYKGGSHRQTLLGVMSKVWIKSKGGLSLGDMKAVQREVDALWGYYCERIYGRASLDEDLRSAMTLIPSDANPSATDFKAQAIERNLKRFSKIKI